MAAKGKLESKIEWKREKQKRTNLISFTSLSNESCMQIHDRAAVALMAKTKIACFLSFNLLVPGVH